MSERVFYPDTNDVSSASKVVALSIAVFRFNALTIETRSLPTLARCYPRSFTFYVAHPIRSIQ